MTTSIVTIREIGTKLLKLIRVKYLREKQEPSSESSQTFKDEHSEHVMSAIVVVFNDVKIDVVFNSHFEGPHLGKSRADYANQDLEDKDKHDLHICLGFKLGELSSRLARVLHDLGFMSSIDNESDDPVSVFKGCSSKKK